MYARADTLPDGKIEQALALIGENNDEESKRDGWWDILGIYTYGWQNVR